jgi:NAD(P)-dependent dehydrogenase (short-subunit alcohol dehydrogenase family)
MARVAVVTGGSAGIGKEAAKSLAAQGWRIIAVGRNPERSAAALAEIKAASNGEPVDMLVGDLAVLREADRIAEEIAGLTDRIDVLFNNAGGVADRQVITSEGNEGTFAGNHLGPFLLTERLTPLLKAAAKDAPKGAVRIINTSSTGHLTAPGFDWDDPQMLNPGTFQFGRAYCNAKLANVLHANVLAKRLAGDGIVAHSMHPGVVDSNFISHAEAGMQSYMRTLDLRPPSEAGDMLAWLATSDEAGQSTGGYFHKNVPAETSDMAKDDALAERLWAESEKLVAKGGF